MRTRGWRSAGEMPAADADPTEATGVAAGVVGEAAFGAAGGVATCVGDAAFGFDLLFLRAWRIFVEGPVG